MIINPSGSVVISAVTIVDENGDAASISGGTQYAADAAHASGNTGTLALAVRRDAVAVGSSDDGDNSTLNVDASGRLWVQVGAISGVVPAFGTGAAGATVLRTLSATDDPIVTAITSGVTTALPAGAAYIGSVSKTVVKDVTLTLDTSAYASGDVIAATQQVNAALRITDGTGMLSSIEIIDKDDQGAAFTIYILSADVAVGTENAAPSITDGDAASILGHVDVATGDYKDLGGVKVACKTALNIPVVAVSGTDDLYVAVVNSTGTPTYTASGIVLRLGILQD
jgi:hypothetical protein